nr:NB-ARC domain-containing protein [Anaerolineae bacterium]
LQQFEQCKQALHEELNLPPSAETLALAEMVKKTMQAAAQPAPPQPKVVSPVLPSGPSTTTTMPPTNLPRSLTSFVGRVSALAEVKHLLTSLSLPPLVSVVGAGGSGKTRLAQQVGRELLPAYADGVWWIELAPLADTALMPQAIAKVLNVRAQNGADILDTLLSHMANKRMLLILDNCEHLILGCARLVERLLAQCERLQVLVTSREPLAIAGEGVWRIPLLGVPSATQRQIQSSPSQPSALSGLITNECVALFVARAQAAKSDFALTERSAAAIVQICRRLDGIPLAIELAASRVRAMSAEQIAARLDDKFNLLTGGSRTALPRQQTLQALIDWSYDLLSANEQRLFRALSVFRGGFSIAAVEACGFGDLDTFLRLVDKSLVNLDTTRDEARYFILETVREYAQKLFEQFDEVAAVKARLVAWCVQKVQQAELHLRGQNAAQHFAWYDQERDNLRAAIEYAHQTDLAAAYKLVSGHHMFWASHGYWDEGAAESSRLLSRWNASQMPEYAHLLYNLAVFWVRKMTNTAQAIQDLQHVIALTTQYHLPELMAKSHRMLGHIHYTTTHQLDLAKTHLLIALDLHRSIGNQAGVSAALDGLSDVARFSGAFDEALAYLHESLSIDEARGDVRDIASAHLGLGFTYLSKGDSMQGKYHLKLTYRYLQKIQVVRYYRNVLSGFLRAYVLEKDFLRAAQVKGGYDKLCETESSLIYGDDLLQFNLACEQIKIALPENVYQQAYNEGYAYMTASSDTIDYFL